MGNRTGKLSEIKLETYKKKCIYLYVYTGCPCVCSTSEEEVILHENIKNKIFSFEALSSRKSAMIVL